MKPTRDTAIAAAALVALFVLYVRGIPQAVWNAVKTGGSAPQDGPPLPGPSEPVSGGGYSGPGGPVAPGSTSPGYGGIVELPPGVAPTGSGGQGVIHPVTTIPGYEDVYSQYGQMMTSDGRYVWYDFIVPCAERTGSFTNCLPKG